VISVVQFCLLGALASWRFIDRRYNPHVPKPPLKVPVNLPSGHYDIWIQPGLRERAGAVVSGLTHSKKIGIVTDDQVAPLHLDAVRKSLGAAGIETVAAIIPAGEQHKNIETLGQIYDALLSAKIERSTPVIALGGGVIGDMTGFVAATLLRGVPFIQMPTTLLAMVDASVGGKTGVNHPTGKNLIGAFHQPIGVLIDPEMLRTLPPRELRGGLAECIKHEIIRDADGFDRLEREIGKALAVDVDYLADLVAHNVAIKARVVEADPFENGERAHLNFGHTFGHAIESVSRYEYSHGESIALGMVAATRAANELKLLDDASRDRIEKLIASAQLPVSGMKLDPAQVANAMWFDKKVKSGKIRFVLPDRIGHVMIRDDVPETVARRAIESLA
jgi:3-dehydroquinate synthase